MFRRWGGFHGVCLRQDGRVVRGRADGVGGCRSRRSLGGCLSERVTLPEAKRETQWATGRSGCGGRAMGWRVVCDGRGRGGVGRGGVVGEAEWREKRLADEQPASNP